jgi:hypothetical protein
VIRRTEPTRSLLQGCTYVDADHTDIRARFAALSAVALGLACELTTTHQPRRRSAASATTTKAPK